MRSSLGMGTKNLRPLRILDSGTEVNVTDCRNPHEWWHDSGMIPRYPLFVSAAALVLAAFLVACSAPGNYRNDAAHEALLQTLRQCLVDISITDKNKDFISPCIARDVSSLNGIARDRLIDALGPPRLCIDQTEIKFPQKEDCPANQSPLWSFYRHAGSVDIGGGPQLVCVANTTMHCATVEWRRTK
jgi:hypothetical protein